MKIKYAAAILGSVAMACSSSSGYHCYPIEEADEDWDEIMEEGRGHLNDLDALNLGDGWALISRAEVGDRSCHVGIDKTWYTQGKTL